MAESETMISFSGTRHRLGKQCELSAPGYFYPACQTGWTVLSPREQPGGSYERKYRRDCKHCFPSGASLGAASTTRNPPPGEQGDLSHE